MTSGKRISAMIFCVSPIRGLWLEPIKYYEPDIVHVFKGKDSVSKIGNGIYESEKKNIECKELAEHEVDVTNYDEIISSVMEVKKKLYDEFGTDLDLFINISSGTPEFSAAGSFAAMVAQQAIAFRVGTEFDTENLNEIFRTMEKTMKFSNPVKVTDLKNDEPEDEIIAFLSILKTILEKTKYPKYRDIINLLKEKGEWTYDPDRKTGYGRTPLEEKEERYLSRHYIGPAMENGWVVKPSPNTMKITEAGMAYLSAYSKHIMLAPREEMVNYECMRMERDVCMDFVEIERNGDYERNIKLEKTTIPIRREETETSTVTVGKKKKYTFTIVRNQHR